MSRVSKTVILYNNNNNTYGAVELLLLELLKAELK